jgi:hypothetical protein
MKKIILSLLGIIVVLALSAQVSWAWEKDSGVSCERVFASIQNDGISRNWDGVVNANGVDVINTSGSDTSTNFVTVEWIPTPGFSGPVEATITLSNAGESKGDSNTISGNLDCPAANPTPTQEVTPTPTTAPSTNTGGGSTTNTPSCDDQKPNQPYNILAVAGPGTGQVTLTWGPASGPVSDYSITYSDEPNTQKWGVVSTGNVTKYIISGLAVNKYYFWVNAVNGCMPGSPFGPVTVGGTGGPIQAVLGLSTTSGEENSLLQFVQLFGALTFAGLGFVFFKKNG